MQTMRAMLVLLYVINLLAQFSTGSSTVRQDWNQTNCLGGCEKRASSADVALSLIGFVASALVSLSPLLRVIKEVNGRQNVEKDRWFMAFLALVTLDYVAWVGYSLKGCQYCEAAAFMIISSIIGAMFSCLWALYGLVRHLGRVCAKEDGVVLAISFVLVAGTIGYRSNETESGYYALAGSVAAHLCRLMGTDYTRFSSLQIIVSLIGCVGGFLSIRHPDLAAAQPFWHSSVVVAVIRALEFIWWSLLYLRSSPRLERWLQDARGWIADASA